MAYYFSKFDMLSATTSTGPGTQTSVQGAQMFHMQIFGRSVATTPATSTQIVLEGQVITSNKWVRLSLTDRNSAVATTVMATDSIFQLTDCGGFTALRANVATFNGVGASISAVGCYYGF